MPGRGRYWRKGGLPDDTVTGADIEDGTIELTDLAPALQVTAGSAGHSIEDEGTPLPDQDILNFVGAGVTATDSGGKTVVTIPGGGAGFDPYATTPEDYYYHYDEFFYPNFDPTASNNFYEKIGTGNYNTPPSRVGGEIEQNTGALANDINGTRTCAGGLVGVNIGKKFKVVWATGLKNAPANTAERVGLFAEANAPSGTFPFSSEPNPYIWFAHDGSGNYLAETHNGVTPVSTDTGVLVDTAVHVFEISFDGTTTLTFKIDGTTVHTQTTNLPTGNLSVGTAIQTGVASQKTQKIDTLVIVNDR